MGGCVVGDIVLAPVSFTNQSGAKTRPVLVLAGVGMQDWIVCAMTGRQQGRTGDISITQADMQQGRLRGAGWARPSRLYTLSESLFRRTIGAVSSAKLAQVKAAVRALFP